MYRCEAVSIAGFIQQLAVAYVANGYWLYVTGCVPPHKDPRAVDAKLIDRYGIDCSKFVRCRRKGRGLGNVQYLRFRRFFVLLATPGDHDLLIRETEIEDIRRRPIQCFGYSVGCYHDRLRRWRASVRIERTLFRELKAEFKAAALKVEDEELRGRFRRLPFEPYAPVRRQFLALLGTVNSARRMANLETVPLEALRLRRSPVTPFGTAFVKEKRLREERGGHGAISTANPSLDSAEEFPDRHFYHSCDPQ